MISTKIKKTAAALFAMSALALSGCSGSTEQTGALSSDVSETTTAATAEAASAAASSAPSEENKLTALQVTKIMGNGINLGNTMEAYNHSGYLAGMDPTGFEGAWGMPHTTQEMINSMKAAGFDTLRVPVAWTNGMNFESGDYTIDQRLMDRVAEIVDYAINADMYVIINDHWDGSWWGMFGSASEETRAKAMDMYKSMWSQIAERFGGYSYKLVFESANEELGDRLNDKDIAEDSGSLSTDECYETANLINSEFVKLIRSTGGNNAERFLLIAGYNTDIERTCDDRYKMPEDTAENKLILSVHYYGPWDYCGTKAVNSWGSPLQYEEMNNMLKKLTKFTEQGYGVIIGEYGVLTDGRSTPKPDTDIYYTNFLNNCDLYNYCPLLWDCNGIFKRVEGEIKDATLAKMYKDRRFAAEAMLSDEMIASNAEKGMAEALAAAEARMTDDDDIPASDDTAVAWIMFQSGDYNASYCVGNIYDPTNKTVGIKATNALIEGPGQYTVSLDFTGIGAAKGVNFSALGISNGEKLFPGGVVTIDSFKVDGEEYPLDGKWYTATDDGKCTRVNLYNQWVSKVPDDVRTVDGNTDDLSAQVWKIGAKQRIQSVELTFTFSVS